MDSIQLSKITNLIIGADSKSENRFSNEEIIDYLISSGIERDTVMSLKPRDYKMPSLWLPKLLRNIYESGILIPVLLVMSEKVGFYNKNFTEDIRDAV